MSKPTSTWKNAEREIAKWFPNGRRRGPDFKGESNAGKTDIVSDGWAIEVKHFKSPNWSRIVEAFKQAVTNKLNENDIPVAIIHKAGTPYKESLVVMTLEEFSKYFINEASE